MAAACSRPHLFLIDPQVFLDPKDQVDEQVVLRHYLCPACGYFLNSNVCRPSGEAIGTHTCGRLFPGRSTKA